MQIRPIHDHILFQFVDRVANDSLVSTTKSGIVLSRDLDFDEQRDARWCKVLALGPDVQSEHIKVGEYILVEPLQWTTSVEVDGIRMWKTTEPKVMCTSPEELLRF